MKPPRIFFTIPEMILVLVFVGQIRPGYARYFGQNNNMNPFSSHVCGQSNHETHKVGRVIGGNEAQLGEFPWITSIQSAEGQHFCAGFMISTRFIISAAHCFFSKYNQHVKYHKENETVVLDSMKVSVSRVKLDEPEPLSKKIEVRNLVIHPQFELKGLNNDIAILELQSDMVWSHELNPICLPVVQNEDHGTGDVTVAGWGYRQCGTFLASNELHQITVPLWNADACKKSYQEADYTDFNRRDYVCAGKDGKDISKGDSGGPLMFLNADKRWTAIGIVSSGKFMCSDRVPGVYTRVSSYLQWIDSIIKVR